MPDQRTLTVAFWWLVLWQQDEIDRNFRTTMKYLGKFRSRSYALYLVNGFAGWLRKELVRVDELRSKPEQKASGPVDIARIRFL